MLQFQVLGNYFVPVRLLDSTGVPVTGVTFNNVTATAFFNGGAPTNVSPPDSVHWIEYGYGAYAIYFDNNIWLQVGAITGGSFNTSDVIDGSPSGATGSCGAGPLSVGPIPISLSPTPTGIFAIADTLTDATSPGATCTVTASPSYLVIPNVPGPMVMIVNVSGAVPFVGVYDVVQALVIEVVNLIGSPPGGTIGAALATIISDVSSVGNIGQAIADIHNMEFGKWEIYTTGPDTNRLVSYRTQGTLPFSGISGGSPSGTFTAGEVVQGGTSLARGTVTATTTTSPVSLIDIVGNFQNAETITGQTGGSTATTTGVITSSYATVLQKFNLYDSGGSPTTVNPFQRTPIP